MSPDEILTSTLVTTALGIAGDALKRAIDSGAPDPHAVANAELETMRAGLRAGIEIDWQKAADAKFGGGMIAAGPIVAGLIALAKLAEPHAAMLAGSIAEVAPTVEDGLLLAVTLDAEGGVRPKVLDCRILGDHGHAFGGYQLHRQHIRGPIGDFCRDPKLQAELALRALSHGRTVRTRIAAFMGRRENDREVTRRVIRYERLLGGRS